MPNSTIREIERKGERAASELLGFNQPPSWCASVLMNLLETHLEEANQVLESPALAALLDNERCRFSLRSYPRMARRGTKALRGTYRPRKEMGGSRLRW